VSSVEDGDWANARGGREAQDRRRDLRRLARSRRRRFRHEREDVYGETDDFWGAFRERLWDDRYEHERGRAGPSRDTHGRRTPDVIQ